MQIILCTVNCHTKKTAYGNTISFLFFYDHSIMESLSSINLYGQLMTLMVLCMVIQWFSCFSWIFFWQATSKFLFTKSRVHQRSEKNQRGDNGIQVFHNLHHTVFQCVICLESYNIWVFEIMQTILWFILWTIYDIHATILQHIWLSFYFLFIVWWSTRVQN